MKREKRYDISNMCVRFPVRSSLSVLDNMARDTHLTLDSRRDCTFCVFFPVFGFILRLGQFASRR